MTKDLEIGTSRLVLRDFQLSDKAELLRNVNDFSVTQYLSVVPYPYGEADADDYLGRCVAKRQKEPREDFSLAITRGVDGLFMGSIGLHNIDSSQGVCTIGYWLGKDFRRKGYMFEALNRVLEFAFEELGLRRIEIEAYVENVASNALIRKAGFQFEGLRRKGSVCRATGKTHDTNMYAMLREDWAR